jgi:hypothetical protein
MKESYERKVQDLQKVKMQNIQLLSIAGIPEYYLLFNHIVNNGQWSQPAKFFICQRKSCFFFSPKCFVLFFLDKRIDKKHLEKSLYLAFTL